MFSVGPFTFGLHLVYSRPRTFGVGLFGLWASEVRKYPLHLGQSLLGLLLALTIAFSVGLRSIGLGLLETWLEPFDAKLCKT